jgi:hypothetical protein
MHFYVTDALGINLVSRVDLAHEVDLTLDTGCRDPTCGPILIHA